MDRDAFKAYLEALPVGFRFERQHEEYWCNACPLARFLGGNAVVHRHSFCPEPYSFHVTLPVWAQEFIAVFDRIPFADQNRMSALKVLDTIP